jgi:acetolactate synthase-1/2/3 large subunit
VKNVDVLVKMLEQAGVKWVFGVPSGPVLPLIEALRNSPVDYVLTASETTAGFMASAVGALTGKPGVCVSTLGPGATNLATGVGAAWLDSAPVIAITCNVATPWLSRRIQMRIDHQALFSPISKATVSLQRDGFAAQVADALRLAVSEPPGPVHLDLPEDVGMAPGESPAPMVLSPQAAAPPVPESAFSELDGFLAEARRPVVIGGLGLTRAKDPTRLLQFIEKQNLPFLLTLHAKGFLPESHPNYAGVIGRARRSDVQVFVNRSDLVVAVGYDEIEINYEEWVPAGVPVVHISNRLADVDVPVHAAINVAGDLDAALDTLASLDARANDWTEADIAQHRELLDRNLRPIDAPFSPFHVLDALKDVLPADAILAYDVGAHTHQIATQWRTDIPNSCISTNGWSSMGYGIPAAYAAKLVHPEKIVVGVIGDGCFQMTAGELNVAKRLGLAVPIVVLNDGWLGLIKVKQERKSYGYSGVNLGKPAPAPEHYFGVPACGVHNQDEFKQALDWSLKLDGPSVIEAFVDVEPYSATVYD